MLNSFVFLFFSAGFIRHYIQCPVDGSNLDCRILHEPNNLEDLKNHVLYEITMGCDFSHAAIEFDETTSDFTNPEMDLRQVYYYKKSYLYDLEFDVRSWIFEPITKLEYERTPESTSVVSQRKTAKTSKKTRQYLDAETGYLKKTRQYLDAESGYLYSEFM